MSKKAKSLSSLSSSSISNQIMSTNKSASITKSFILSNIIIHTIISIIINVMIIILMFKLKKIECDCLVDWRNTFIIVYSIIMLVITIIRPVYYYMNMGKLMTNITNILSTLLSIATIINLYCLYTYTKDLDNSNCNCINNCNQSQTRNGNLFGFIYYITRISIYMLLLSILVIMCVSLYTNL